MLSSVLPYAREVLALGGQVVGQRHSVCRAAHRVVALQSIRPLTSGNAGIREARPKGFEPLTF